MDKIVKIKVYAKPNAKQSKLIKISKGEWHIALQAKPQEGEANKELIRFLSTLLRVPKTQIILEKGVASRYKLVSLPENTKVKALLEQEENE